MRSFVLPGLLALTALGATAAPSSAQTTARTPAAGQRCPGCDSAAMAGATVRSRDADIAGLTIELARNRILVEHIRARLAEGSSEPPASEKERVELQSMLVVRRREMERLERQLSALCGDASPVRGYIGFDIQVKGTAMDSGGRSTVTMAYPVVTRVAPGSPAAQAGIVAYDTIVSINKLDAREHPIQQFIRQGERLSVSLARGDVRRNVTVTVGQPPATFGGSCLQFRNVVFADPSGQYIATVRAPGARGSVGATTGTIQGRARVGGARGQGGGDASQPVRVVMPPDSLPQGATFFFVPSGASATALFMPRGATGAIVAGAEVALINGGLKTVFAVDHGALVVNVAPRSPADQAGIVSGDVIVRAQGDPVTAISVLQQAIRASGDRRSVALEIVRAKQAKSLTLRW